MKYASFLLAILLSSGANAATASISAPLTITVFPFSIAFAPNNPSLVCSAAPGSTVSQATASGGDGNPITWSMTGSSDFVINASTGLITVAPSGIASADCPASGTNSIAVNVTASQN